MYTRGDTLFFTPRLVYCSERHIFRMGLTWNPLFPNVVCLTTYRVGLFVPHKVQGFFISTQGFFISTQSLIYYADRVQQSKVKNREKLKKRTSHLINSLNIKDRNTTQWTAIETNTSTTMCFTTPICTCSSYRSLKSSKCSAAGTNLSL